MENSEEKVIATHTIKDNEHQVAVTYLNVVMCEDGGQWFAQGLEIDYASYGKTIEEAKKNFETGLAATIHEHIKIIGDLSKFFKPAPAEAWEPVYTKKFTFAGE